MKAHLQQLALAILLVAAPWLARPLAAQQVDVIRGRVTAPDGSPVDRVNVTATSLNGGVNRTARTDASGRFTITFPGGEGDYLVGFTALGFAPRRFEVKRTADQEILVADVTLQRAAAVLDTVRAVAERARASRNERDVAGGDRPLNPGNLSAADQGDLNALAGSIPGITPVFDPNGDPAGWSVLGLSPDQNSSTLNDSHLGGSNLPRDAAVSTSINQNTYDVSRGGFSGGQLNVRTQAGSNFIRRTNSLNLDQPGLQWTDRAARDLGQRYSNFSLGGLLSGPIETDKAFYSLAYQLGRRASDLHSLVNTNALGLETSGVAADSVSRLLGLLNTAQVPAIARQLGNSRVGEQGSVLTSIDVAPPGSASAQTFNVTANAFWTQTTPATQLSYELPSHSGDRTSWNGTVMGRHSAYVNNILTETTVGMNRARNYGTPYLQLPNGMVLVNSQLADGTNSVRPLSFGGNPFIGTSGTTTNADFANAISWLSTDNRHRLKLTTELRREAYEQDQTINGLGTFSFNSLADLEARRPAAFTRQLGQRVQGGSEYLGAMSLGDTYRWSSDLQLQYGVRVDANRFARTPAYDADVERLFGRRNDVAPNRAYVSPRLGFSWTYGTAPQVASFEGAARGPRAVVRGGIGLFQNTPNAALIGSAIDNTGLASGVQQLTCVGGAAPVPDWSAYLADAGTIPTRCADGSIFSSNVPNVRLFAPDYAAQRRLGSNLQWNGPLLGNRFTATIEATYSRNMNQPGAYDLNFVPVPRFTLPGEDNRPVYARPGSIVPATGQVALGDSRLSPLFNQVHELRSDLLGEARQLRVQLSPGTFSSGFSWGLTYLLSDIREQTRGFTSTAGDPTAVEWSRSSFDSRHQVSYSVGYNFFDAVRLNWFGQLRSGTPFTPQVATDVNGDGYANDRAFVFDPDVAAAAGDAALAAGMRALLASGAPEARDCLQRQENHLASRMSCEGPWTSSAVLGITFNPLKLRLPQRANLSFQLSNPLGAADLLLHGESRLHGWGQNSFPDQNLLYVRGFDPVAQRYRYEVNSRFGNSSPQANATRTPVTLTAMLRFDIGPSRERQVLTQALDRGRSTKGDKVPEGMLKAQYGTGGIVNPMAQLLRQGDTLQLTGAQADTLATLNRWYVIHLDSIWTPVTRRWATLPAEYDQGAAYAEYRRGREASVDLLISIVPRINRLLTDTQRRMLPPFLSSVLDTRYLASIRSGTAGTQGGPQFTPGGAGGGERVIIRSGP